MTEKKNKIKTWHVILRCMILLMIFVLNTSVTSLVADSDSIEIGQKGIENTQIRILSPKNDEIWVGSQKIEIDIGGVSKDVLKKVSVFLDGRLIKEFSEPPYKFNYNFGQAPVNHKLEILLIDKNKKIRRKGIHSYHLDDSQEVDILQVVVPVVVTDRRGNYVSNLKKEDFEILEDGVPQDISYFGKSGKSTFHLVLLIDISGSMKDKISKVKEVAKQFLRQLMTKDDRAITVFFNHEVFEDSDFTSDIYELDNTLSIAMPYGATALYDAIAYSVKLMKSIIGHNIIILFSDGEDNSSAIDPYTLINIVERSNSVIYSIGKNQFMEGYDQYQELLRKISLSSGGMTFFLDNVQEVKKVYEKIRMDIKAKFIIRFSPKDKKRNNRFRKISVKLKKRRGYKIRTMKGYYY